MRQWDQGSLGEMRVDLLLATMYKEIGLPVTWLPLACYGRCDPRIVEIHRERDLDLYNSMDPDEAIETAFRVCLQGVMYQVRWEMKGMGSLIIDAPGKWPGMHGQGVVGPVRVGLIRDYLNFQVRVGIRVLGILYMLARASETRVVLPADRAHLKVEA